MNQSSYTADLSSFDNEDLTYTHSVGLILMASGQSVRFGRNKLLADFGGRPLISYALNTLNRTPEISSIAVTRTPEIIPLCQEKGLPVLLHSLPFRSDTIRLGLTFLLEHTRIPLSCCIFLSADQPLLKKESLLRLLQEHEQYPDAIIRLEYQGTPGNPVLFPSRYFPELLSLKENQGGSAIVKKNPRQVRMVPVGDSYELFDIDTEEDLLTLLPHLHEAEGYSAE